jgi:hypothetical protein
MVVNCALNIMEPMNKRLFCAALSLLMLAGFSARAEYMLMWSFKGVSYETNASGNVTTTVVTDQTILQEKCTLGGISTNGLALVYHLGGGFNYWDSVDIVHVSDGSVVTSVLGYYFADDASLGRAAITNGTQTEYRRLDYIYTDQNSHSMGAAFTTKRVLGTSPNTHTTAEGPVMWLELPRGPHNTRVYNGTFTTGAKLF